jgi:hypothetical protein
MSEKLFEKIEITKIVAALFLGAPWITIMALVFQLGNYKREIESRAFDNAQQKQQVITRTYDESIHWNYEKLDARYVVKTELTLTLDQIQHDQEKIMKKLEID